VTNHRDSGLTLKSSGAVTAKTKTTLNADIQQSVRPHGALKVFALMFFNYAEKSGLSSAFALAPARPFL
jgi:hypothetical protein